MKKLTVEVCVCTRCVMNGAMDLIEAVESLKKLKGQLRLNTQVQIVPVSCIGDCKHAETAPVARVDGEIINSADSETIMSRIVEATTKEVTAR